MVIYPVAPYFGGRDSLLEAIATVPIPGAPPRLSRDGAAVGLAFLDMALRQNHIRRLTERLTLIEDRIARCTIEVDVSLGMLDEEQRQAGLLYQRIRSRGASIVRDSDARDGSQADDGEENPDALTSVLWVPISLARRSHAPVDVINGDGAKLPRLTEYETSRLLASAMYRLIRLILSSQPDANIARGATTSDLQAFLYHAERPRWLLQAALVTLLTERNKPAAHGKEFHARSVNTADAKCRESARKIFDTYEPVLADYIKLLDIVVNEHLLIVALNPQQDDHLLAFDSPVHVDGRPRRTLVRALGLSSSPYWVKYETKVPATLRAYHLVAQTEQGLVIDTMSLSSDADDSIVQSLTTDLYALASRLNQKRPPMANLTAKGTELELQNSLRRLSELVRRRRWDASRANRRIPRRELHATRELARAVMLGGVDKLPTRPGIGPLLALAAKEIKDQHLELDFSVETEPPSTRAHVYWRRDPSRVEIANAIHISANVFLRDISGYRSSSIAGYVVSVVGVSYLLACLRFGLFWPFGRLLPHGAAWPWFSPLPLKAGATGDAIIAVLLLVPGFLYTRLNLPQRHSIAGHLRRFPRVVAYVTIASAAGIAAAFAATDDTSIIQTALAIGLALPVLFVVLLRAISSAVIPETLPATVDTPAWVLNGRASKSPVRMDVRVWPRGKLRTPDSHFRTYNKDQKPSRIRRLVHTLRRLVAPTLTGKAEV